MIIEFACLVENFRIFEVRFIGLERRNNEYYKQLKQHAEKKEKVQEGVEGLLLKCLERLLLAMSKRVRSRKLLVLKLERNFYVLVQG